MKSATLQPGDLGHSFTDPDTSPTAFFLCFAVLIAAMLVIGYFVTRASDDH